MAINPDYPMLTWEQANPFQTGLMKSKELLAKQLANQYAQEQNKIAGVKARYEEPLSMQELVSKQLMNRIQEIKSRYEEPRQRADLEKALQYNQYYGPNMQSQIGLRGAQAGHYGELNKDLAYARAHPLMQAPETKYLGALMADPKLGPLIAAALQRQQQGGAAQDNMPVPGAQPQQREITPTRGGEIAQTVIPGAKGEQEGRAQIPQIGEIPETPTERAAMAQAPRGQAPMTQGEALVQAFLAKQSAENKSKESLEQLRHANLIGKPWKDLPAPEKNNAIAQSRAAGVNQTEAANRLEKGESLGQIMASKGYSETGEDWPNPIYTPTTATLTQQERANIAQAGIQAVSPDITEALKPYAKQWNGTSLNQLYDLAGANPKRAGRAIGAGAMALELSVMRLRSGGVTPGLGTIRDTLEKGKLRLNTPGLSMTPEAFEEAQNFIDEKIAKLNAAENKALYPQGKRKGEGQKISEDTITQLARRKGKSPDEIKQILRARGMIE
jgi:hypothetical protein